MNSTDVQSFVSATPLSSASIWILSKYIELEKVLEAHLKDYELVHSIDALYKFLWDYYADWYVEYLKTDTSQIPFAKELFRQYIITLSPYCPFETEALWQQFFGETDLLALTVKQHDWSTAQLKQIPSIDIQKDFELVINFISRVRSLRGLFAIDPVVKLKINTDNQNLESFSSFIALAGKCELIENNSKGNYEIQTTNYTFSLDILSYIKDISSEIQRTNKIILSLDKQINGLNSQLDNPKFVEYADPEILIEKKNQLQTRQLEMQEQKEKLTILQNKTN